MANSFNMSVVALLECVKVSNTCMRGTADCRFEHCSFFLTPRPL